LTRAICAGSHANLILTCVERRHPRWLQKQAVFVGDIALTTIAKRARWLACRRRDRDDCMSRRDELASDLPADEAGRAGLDTKCSFGVAAWSKGQITTECVRRQLERANRSRVRFGQRRILACYKYAADSLVLCGKSLVDLLLADD
jgi:hypothetical protein